MKITEALKHLLKRGELRELGSFNLEKRRLREDKYVRREMKPSSFQWCPVTEEEAVGTSSNARNSI